MPFIRDSKFTKYLVKEGFLKENPLTVVDIGARGGLEPHWASYGGGARFVGFEPDPEECERLNKELPPESKNRFYPIALHRDKGERTFYHQAPASSGFYLTDSKFAERFLDKDVRVRATSTMKTSDLDSFAEENKLPEIDFMKTDAEGGDLDVLKGSIKQIKKTVLGVSSEVYFSPWRGGNSWFSEVEQFLRPLGFLLYDIDLYRFANRAFPGIQSAAPTPSNVAPFGQINFCQAVFLRDAVAEIENKKLLERDWDEERVLKMVSLFEHFSLPDCAIELLETAKKHNILSDKIDLVKSRDLIVSGYLGHGTTYEQYMSKLEKIRRRGYLNILEYWRPLLRNVPYIKDARDFLIKTLNYIKSYF